MVRAGVHIVPLMPAADVVVLAKEAEALGYDYVMVADEGFHPDIYACLGAIASATSTISIGAMTNPYTRHPAVTATGMATVNEISGGRALLTLLAGGSMVLNPMGIERKRPYRVLADATQVITQLWSGESVTFDSESFSLDNATLGLGAQSIPLWIASRGPLLLGLAGRSFDGVVLTVKPDLPAAIDLVEVAAAKSVRPSPERIYLGRICYSPDLIEGQRKTLSFVLMDSPERVLDSLGFDDDQIALVNRAAKHNRPELVDPLVTDELLRQYQVAGTPAQCSTQLGHLVNENGLDVVLVDALSSDLDENLDVLATTLPIIRNANP